MGRLRLRGAALTPRFLHERDEFLDTGLELRGLQPVRPQFRSRGEGGVGIDLETDGFMAGEIGLDQRRADAGKRVEDCSRTVHVHVDGAGHELAGITRNPRNPPMNGLAAVRGKSQVAKIRPGAVARLRIALRVVKRQQHGLPVCHYARPLLRRESDCVANKCRNMKARFFSCINSLYPPPAIVSIRPSLASSARWRPGRAWRRAS